MMSGLLHEREFSRTVFVKGGGALIVGLVIQIAGTYTSSAYQLVYAFLLLVVLMLFRPNGVFVRRSSTAVRA